MLRKTIYATPILILTIAAASAQTDKPGLSGYTNTLRSGQEKKNDIEIDSAYQSAKKVVPDTKKKNLIRGAMSAQSQQRPKTNDSECRLHAVSRRLG
jgi:hypothetical protein